MARETFHVTYLNDTGQIVGYLSRNRLIARKVSNALVTDAIGLPSARAIAARLLEGPHPLDHLGPIYVGLEEL